MNKTKIAIHNNQGGFSEHWINYCIEKKIDFKLVDCYQSDIILQLDDCNALMWHPLQYDYKATLFFKQLLYSLQTANKKIFPDFNTVWHFDDKVGQKYLLESIKAPLASSFVFYSLEDALKWAKQATFPKVFKLRGGAGSKNVKLIKTDLEAIRVIKKAFGHGFSQYDKFENLKERYRKFSLGLTSLNDLLRGVVRLFYPPVYTKILGRERGYVYFQEFLPNNSYDIRVIVTGKKAFSIKRMVRKNDFRASGSGELIYDKSELDERCVQIAFDVNNKLKSQSIAYDFVYDKNNNPLIIEISYGFVPKGYDKCTGYWDDSLNWYGEEFNPYGWMVENLII